MDGDLEYYHAHAKDVDLSVITSSEDNSELLYMLRRGYCTLDLRITREYDPEAMNFVIRDDDHFGWLGYYIGESMKLISMDIQNLPHERERRNDLLAGLSRNESISSLRIDSAEGGDNFIDLGSVIRKKRLDQLKVLNFDIGIDQARNFALGLREQASIRFLHLIGRDTGMGDDGFARIAEELNKQSNLRKLTIKNNSIGANSCSALGTMVGNSFSRLENLDLSYNNIDDTGLGALVGGLSRNDCLTHLDISGNQAITATGLKSLSPLFRTERCRLESIVLEDMYIGDDGAEALAAAVAGNTTLKSLYFNCHEITDTAWSAFSRLLCDKSSIMSTYRSNHTLRAIGSSDHRYIRYEQCPIVAQYLSWNSGHRQRGYSNTALKPQISKILFSYRDLDLEPFFQYKLKFLPVVVHWLQSVTPHLDVYYNESIKSIDRRKLAAIYNFIRSMPQVATNGFWAQVLKETGEKKRKLQLELDELDKTFKIAVKRVKGEKEGI